TLGWHPSDINGFASNYIHKNMLNGSLWTLGFEFTAYVLLSIILFRKKNIIASTFFAICFFIVIQLSILNVIKIPHTVDLNRLSLLCTTFLCGSLLYITRSYWSTTSAKITLIVLALSCALFISEKNEYDLMFYISVPFFIVPL